MTGAPKEAAAARRTRAVGVAGTNGPVRTRNGPRDPQVQANHAGGSTMAVADAPVGPVSRRYPVHVQAAPQPVASRWLWLVKWLLAIPHYVVLAFLWIAFMVLSIVALVAILITGRYPRAIFDFNVGVLRWSWRVAYYSLRRAGHGPLPAVQPARQGRLPGALRRRLPRAPVPGAGAGKWWLLAIPQYIVVGVFLGSGTWAVQRSNGQWQPVWGGGLLGILVLVAAVLLAFTGSYPRPLYDLLLGVNRWVLRVAAYVGADDRRVPAVPPGHGRRGPRRRAAAAGLPAAATGQRHRPLVVVTPSAGSLAGPEGALRAAGRPQPTSRPRSPTTGHPGRPRRATGDPRPTPPPPMERGPVDQRRRGLTAGRGRHGAPRGWHRRPGGDPDDARQRLPHQPQPSRCSSAGYAVVVGTSSCRARPRTPPCRRRSPGP